MKLGDVFLVIDGEYQGMVLSVRSIHYKKDGTPFYFPDEDLKGGEEVHFSENEIREWTKKDERIKSKFHTLFQLIGDNKTTLIARAARDIDDNYVRRLIEIHHEDMILVKEKYELFLFEMKFSDKTIAELNGIWRKEKKCVDLYANPKWGYDKISPLDFHPKHTLADYRNLLSFQPTAHAVIHNVTA